MNERRGSNFYRSDLADAVRQFQEGDVVTPVITGSDRTFYGIVRGVVNKENKVYVAWNNGAISQHDPDEVMLALDVTSEMKARLSRIASVWDGTVKSRRGTSDEKLNIENTGPAYSGDPKVHGIDAPRGGGFSIMQRLQKDLHEESIEDAGLVEDEDTVKASRRIAKKVQIPEKFTKGRKDQPDMKFFLEMKGSKIVMTFDGPEGPEKGFVDAWTKGGKGLTVKTYPNEYRKGWHNGVKRALNMAMGSINDDFAGWVKNNFPKANIDNPKKASHDGLRSRRALYHRERGRVYRQTRSESQDGSVVCGRRGCGGVMELQPFTKSVKLYVCKECGWKITNDKVV